MEFKDLDAIYESYMKIYEEKDKDEEEYDEDEEESCEDEKKSKKKMKESYDHYDIVLEYLLDEGLCESVENAEIMMAHMSEAWIDGIIESYELDEATIMSVSRGGKPVYKLSKIMNRLQTAAARERQDRQERKASSARKSSEEEERKKLTKSSIERLNAIKNATVGGDSDTVEELPQSNTAGYRQADLETHLAHVRKRARARRGR